MVNDKEPERNFKNNLFIDYIGTKENLIEVYNAVSGKDYSPDTEIEINTLKNILYRYRINDISFVIDEKLIVLIEHQSTINENMPLRMLEYITALLTGDIDKKAFYQKKQIKIPRPEFIVFYDGNENYPEHRRELLSKAYIEGDGSTLELAVDVYNINLDKNNDLLEKCKALRDYSTFVAKVYEYEAEGATRKEAMDKTFEYCREYGIMDIYLEKRGGEAVSLLFEQYNYEDELRVVKEEALNEGLSIGEKKGREEERLANAQRMKADGVEPALIAKYTGLTVDEITRL
jgi:hypothetical protein